MNYQIILPSFNWSQGASPEGRGYDKVMKAEVSKKPGDGVGSIAEFGLCLAFRILSRPGIIFVYPEILDNTARNPNPLGGTLPVVII